MKKTLNIVFGFSILFGLVVLIIFFIQLLWILIGNANEIQKTILIATIPGVISIFGIFLAENWRRNGEIKNKNREKKEKAYDDFMKVVFDYMWMSKTGKKDDELQITLVEASRSLIIWASDDVIKKYSEFRQLAQKNDAINILGKMEEIMIAIRKDLGQKNTNIKRFDLMRLVTKLD